MKHLCLVIMLYSHCLLDCAQNAQKKLGGKSAEDIVAAKFELSLEEQRQLFDQTVKPSKEVEMCSKGCWFICSSKKNGDTTPPIR